jgi:hypothetical protein
MVCVPASTAEEEGVPGPTSEPEPLLDAAAAEPEASGSKVNCGLMGGVLGSGTRRSLPTQTSPRLSSEPKWWKAGGPPAGVGTLAVMSAGERMEEGGSGWGKDVDVLVESEMHGDLHDWGWWR